MTAIFPEFKDLEFSDRELIESHTAPYPPYSDYNFVSLWSWNVKNQVALSELNGNLVCRFTDYISEEPFLSFLGSNDLDDTITKLLSFAEQAGYKKHLKLLPEDNFKQQPSLFNLYKIAEDEDSFDYIYSTEKLVELAGNEYAQCRKMVNRFTKRYGDVEVKELDLKNTEIKRRAIELSNLWQSNKELDFYNKNEEGAENRLFDSVEDLNLLNVGVYVNNELVAFTINERVDNNGYSVSHFAKFDVKYTGVYTYSMKVTADILLQHGSHFLNCEQDLGLPGLRYSKQALRPVFYLKKYILRSQQL